MKTADNNNLPKVILNLKISIQGMGFYESFSNVVQYFLVVPRIMKIFSFPMNSILSV